MFLVSIQEEVQTTAPGRNAVPFVFVAGRMSYHLAQAQASQYECFLRV
jgi:hypothetical protein